MVVMMTKNDVASSITDASIASLTTRWGMGGGTVTSIFGWLSSNQFAVLIGIAVTLLGFIINAIFQYRREKRSSAESALQKKLLLDEDRRKEELHLLQITKLQREIGFYDVK